MIPFWCNGASIEFSTICMNWNFAFNNVQIPTQLQVLLLNNGAVKCFHRWFFYTLRLLLSNSNNHKNSLLDYHFEKYILFVEKRWQPKAKEYQEELYAFDPKVWLFFYVVFLFFSVVRLRNIFFLYKFKFVGE